MQPLKPNPRLTLLHTSDWHIGRMLCGRRRYEEFEAFFDWLVDVIHSNRVDVVVVAGDVFDTAAPSNRSQEIYYRFLHRIADRSRHVVVVGGNHDSPTFLDAPSPLLKSLNVHVVGAAKTQITEEIIPIEDSDGKPLMWVCAVPYLRDRDVRIAGEGETTAEKDENLRLGIARHYETVFAEADAIRNRVDSQKPVVVTGHLYTKGGKTAENDGVRELYVGSLARVENDTFSSGIDYLALGHLHLAQTVALDETRRYSGAPIHMGFDELGFEKSVVLVQFENRQASPTVLPVPCFLEKRQIEGNLEEIIAALSVLKSDDIPVWVEVIYDGEGTVPGLREQIYSLVEDSPVSVLRIRNAKAARITLVDVEDDETLENLSVYEVFQRCMDVQEVPPEERVELLKTFNEILTALETGDPEAE